MPIFRVTKRDESASIIVRERCFSCARLKAAEEMPASEFEQWASAGVTWIADAKAKGYEEEGSYGIVKPEVEAPKAKSRKKHG